MTSHFIGGPGRCLSCSAEMTAATNVSGEGMPEVGDVTVCLYCGHLMEFGIGLVLVQPTDETIVKYAGHQDLLKAMRVVASYRREARMKGSKR